MRHTDRGISLVELMVGIAVGLLVVAAATTTVTAQLGSTRVLLQESLLDQDLRTAAEVVTRELRRSAASVINNRIQWYGLQQDATVSNDSQSRVLVSGDASSIAISYRRGPGEEGFAFKRENDTLKMLIPDGGSGVWQELTDPAAVRITRFSVAEVRAGDRARSDNLDPHIVACPYLCADGSTSCWPRIQPQEFVVEIEAESRRDPGLRRLIRTSVAPRASVVTFRSFGGQGAQTHQACPTLPG